VVTGGGIGLGKTFSRGFASAGAKVVVADIAEEEAVALEVRWLSPKKDCVCEGKSTFLRSDRL